MQNLVHETQAFVLNDILTSRPHLGLIHWPWNYIPKEVFHLTNLLVAQLLILLVNQNTSRCIYHFMQPDFPGPPSASYTVSNIIARMDPSFIQMISLLID